MTRSQQQAYLLPRGLHRYTMLKLVILVVLPTGRFFEHHTLLFLPTHLSSPTTSSSSPTWMLFRWLEPPCYAARLPKKLSATSRRPVIIKGESQNAPPSLCQHNMNPASSLDLGDTFGSFFCKRAANMQASVARCPSIGFAAQLVTCSPTLSATAHYLPA